MNWLNRKKELLKTSIVDSVRRPIARTAPLTTFRGKLALARLMAAIGMALTISAIFFIQSQRATGRSGAAAYAARRAARAQSAKPPLDGYVDMHTHPMSHLGFGKKLVHGAPDIGSIVPKGTYSCNNADFRAKSMAEALSNCNSTHGGWGLDNPCGDTLRSAMINMALDSDFKYILPPGDKLRPDHQHAGYPMLQYWPHQTSKLHQQMWYEWIKRARDGGLRVMVALSVNNQLLAEALNGDEPKQDKPSSDLQVKEIKSFVGRHNDFMEVAYSSADLRRIAGAGKLAVVLGMEVDDFGGFGSDPNWHLYPEIAKKTLVKAEIKRVYDLGVRYIFPIHLTNNVFGGTAAYEVFFNFANKHNTGKFLSLQHTTDESIDFDMNLVDGIQNNGVMFTIRTALEQVGELPAPCINDVSCLPGGKVRCCSNALNVIKNAMTPDAQWAAYQNVAPGQINAQGLTDLGKFALEEMMKMGIMIDLDHMGRKSITDSLEVAEEFSGGYPVNMGHNHIRHDNGHGTERNISAFSANRVAKLGGMIGVGTANLRSDVFIAKYLEMVAAAGHNGDIFVAPGIGTDVNGFEPLPAKPLGLDSDKFYSNFTKSGLKDVTGHYYKTWDYTKEGVAHYGLMSDFFQDVKTRGDGWGAGVYARIRQSAEYFARMWEKCEDIAESN